MRKMQEDYKVSVPKHVVCSLMNVRFFNVTMFIPLNAELNPICHLLALLGVHFLHVSRIGVNDVKKELAAPTLKAENGCSMFHETTM